MKLLLDTCVSAKTRDVLKDAGYDIVWTGDWEEDPGDEEILAVAYKEERILITLDKDFGELTIVRQLPHAGILRLANLPVKRQAPVCLQVLEQYAEDLQNKAIITVEPDRIRIRTADTDSE